VDADSNLDAAPRSTEDPTRTMHLSEVASGATIGPYQLVRQLGEGGMGVVYHAQQFQPIRRDVALKVIKPGMDSKHVIARFESERQALAMMDHPNIARVFDAGTTATSLPYFVMELVNGLPITHYCDSERLTVRERIELFIPLCQAIQHAHQKGVIHRDIKPSNILVAEQEGKPVAKVIDFGLAKALGHQLSDATLMTDVGTVVGTLEYMSPEQAELTRQDIDTRSDVYSLGAVLYELLTGTTPLEREHSGKDGYLETLRRIREDEPPRPSMRLRGLAQSTDIAARRRSDPERLPKLLRGELDWIVTKALEKDRKRRYETVNGLVRDLERYLLGDPVEAGQPSTTYRLRKLIGRHRLGLAVGAAFAVLLVTGAVIGTWMAVRASRAEAEARAVNDFLQTDLLAQASADMQARPGTKPDPDIKVRTALDRAAGRIEGKFGNQPMLEASIRQTIGHTYLDLGLYPEAQRQVERALELRRRVWGERNRDTLTSMNTLASIYLRQGNYSQAMPLAMEVLQLRRRVLGAEHPDTLLSLKNLAAVYGYQGKYAQEESLETEALATLRRVRGEDHPDTVDTMMNLAGTYHEEGKYAQAEPLLTAALQARRRVSGPEHPRTLLIINNLANVYLDWKKYAQAEPLYSEAVEVERRVLGEEHPETLRSMSNLGMLYDIQGKYPQAESLDERTLAVRRRISGEGNTSTLIMMDNLVDLYNHEGKYAEAEALSSVALQAGRRAVGEEHPVTLDILRGLADVYRNQGKYAQAVPLYTKVLEAERRVLGEEHPDTLNTMTSLGRVRLLQFKYSEAEATLRDALRIYESANIDFWERYHCQNLLGASLLDQKKFEEAEPFLIFGYERMVQREAEIPAFGRSDLAEAGDRIIRLYRDWEKPAKVAEWQERQRKTKIAASPKRP
jgi:serine/threonine protein kinase/tetratricopeptide (TPR) repeat protein